MRDDVPEEIAYQMAKLTAEHIEELKATHPSTAKYFDIENVVRVSPVPLHPGAIRYLEEIGVDVPDRLKAD